MFYQLKVAEEKDLARLLDFVERAGLSSSGIELMVDYFVMMENGEREVVACIGVEPAEDVGLLRSLVVSDTLQQAHILTLFQSIQTLAEQKGLKQLFLVTNKEASVQFLQLMGFTETNPEQIPKHLLTNEHIQSSMKEENTKIMVKSS
ncbi:GNAT family N-acetyltransferase [Metabacillus malikii]|uniref:N-acetylglutamate synthase-like GNAT family acetyltransferase n=1 Tax=Metabacillus malikii TaxID=1504265 RepID=A0ABT9ZIP6_9BACI|nr:hypothetical protein [Metabacillus malikii]MDQ0232150.1 N-acetylglutamate synthase-like GNAT family acetyltransferase [Metabacillus malikii]